MYEDFEIILKAKYKLPKIEDIPSVPTGGKFSLDDCLTLSSVNGGSPCVFPGFPDERTCSCILSGDRQVKIFFTVFPSSVFPSSVNALLAMLDDEELLKKEMFFNGRSWCTDLFLNFDRRKIERAVFTVTARFGRTSQIMLVPLGHVVESKELNRGLVDFLETNQFSDVTFIVDGTKISSHKSILAARSEYFCKMFSSGMKESETNEVIVDDCTLPDFRLFLDILYGGFCLFENDVRLTLSGVIGVLGLADKYQLTGLTQSCLEFIDNATLATNVSVVLKAASDLNNEELRDISFRFLKKMNEKDRWNILQDLGDESLIRQFLGTL